MELTELHLWAVPIVTVLVQCLKLVPFIKERSWLAPWASVGIGLAFCGLASLAQPIPDVIWSQALGIWAIEGIVAGLAAAGLYSLAGKKVLGGIGAVLSGILSK